MRSSDLRREIDIELEATELTVQELAALRRDVGAREPTIRELAAAALFLANFYCSAFATLIVLLTTK